MGKVNKVRTAGAIVHLMLPQFVPDVTIHVDSLEIYDVTSLCVRSYQARSQKGIGDLPPPPFDA